MLARAHSLCSIAITEAGLLVTHHLDTSRPVPLLIMLAATSVGALLPDVDQRNSTASRNSPINFSFFFRHRGITHTIVGWLIFSFVLYFVMNYFRPIPLTNIIFNDDWGCLWLGLVIGYILHLVEDGFSRGGINWFWPLTKKPLKLWPHYKVGGKFEHFLTFLAKLSLLGVSFYWIYLFLAGNYQLF